jgi:hypothetical protein
MDYDPRSSGDSERDKATIDSGRRTVMQLGAIGAAGLAGCFHDGEDGPSSPVDSPTDTGEPTATPSPTPLANPETVKEDLQRWGQMELADGDEGRPFPVTGSWNIGRYYNIPWKTGEGYNDPRAWSAKYFTELIEEGHHVLPTYADPVNSSTADYKAWESVDQESVSDNCSDALEYCATHDLPIAFRGWNYGTYPKGIEENFSTDTETTALFVKNGQKTGKAGPLAPLEAWKELGRAWWGQPKVHRMQKCHPDPPKIVCLDNGEAGTIGAGAIDTNADRFVAEYGEDTIANMSDDRKEEIIAEGYAKRYQAMFAGAREVLSEEWADAINFVGYNQWGFSDVMGRQAKWNGWEMDRTHDGSMPEYYDNEWEGEEGKSDHSPWSLQAEACNVAAPQDRFFDNDEDYYFSNIGWEGSPPDQPKPAFRHHGSKPNQYIVGDLGETSQEWDLDRYQGVLQFGLWLQRPRSFREFRGGGTLDAYNRRTWMRYVEMVDRVWASEDLHEFWKHGDLVANESEEHFLDNMPNAPEWVQELDRWFILTCDANPPRSEWESITIPENFPFEPYPEWDVDIRVFPMALAVGEEPERRWLMYAHAPLGAVADATIELPGYGAVDLDYVAKNGTFAIVDEAEDSVSIVRQGGPAQLNVDAASDVVGTGESVEVTAEVGCPPDSGFDSFTWAYGGETTAADSLGTTTVSFDEPGQHQIRVTGTTGGGGEVAATTTVHVGEAPPESVVYDLPLDKASAYEGPWGAVGKEFPGELMTYRLAPNPAGAAPRAPVHGGEFVEDPEQGRVLELDRPDAGLWLVRSELTSRQARGHASKTITLRFNAESVEGTQWLYKEGGGKRFEIFIEDGTLKAGTVGQDGTLRLEADVSAEQWHHVALVLDGAGIDVTDGAMSLYLDGEEVASGPGVRIPNHNLAPKVGWAGPRGNNPGFTGRIADFLQANDALPPE